MHMEKHVNELMFCATEDQKKIDHLESLISELRAELKERSLLPLSSTISTQTEAGTYSLF